MAEECDLIVGGFGNINRLSDVKPEVCCHLFPVGRSVTGSGVPYLYHPQHHLKAPPPAALILPVLGDSGEFFPPTVTRCCSQLIVSLVTFKR